jgi:hypothetical protein
MPLTWNLDDTTLLQLITGTAVVTSVVCVCVCVYAEYYYTVL